MMAFDGFPLELKSFLVGLEANNNRAWFADHRSAYDDHVIAPAKAFVAAMAVQLAKIDPRFVAEPKVNGSIRRLHRDTRFSKDKTPFSPRLHLIFWIGDHPLKSPGFHLVIAARTYGFGAGHWGFEPAQLARFRAQVSNPKGAKDLQGILNAAEAAGAGRIDPPALKRIPPGYSASAPGADLLRHKGCVIKSGEHDLAPIFDGHAVDTTMAHLKLAGPLIFWLLDKVYR